MGISVEARVCFGVRLDNDCDVSLPWHDEDGLFEGDIEVWWRHAMQFSPKHPDPYSRADWQRRHGSHDFEVEYNAYHKERDLWDEANPLPFKLVSSGYIDEPDEILAVPSSLQEADWSEPKPLSPWPVGIENAEEKLLEFCKQHSIPTQGRPQWYLMAFQG